MKSEELPNLMDELADFMEELGFDVLHFEGSSTVVMVHDDDEPGAWWSLELKRGTTDD